MLPPTDDWSRMYGALNTLDDYNRFLSMRVETARNDQRIGGYRVDEGRGFVRLQIRHTLANLFRPAIRWALANALQVEVVRRAPAHCAIQVEASYVPLWMRRKQEAFR